MSDCWLWLALIVWVKIINRNIWLISVNAKCWIKIANEWWLVSVYLSSCHPRHLVDLKLRLFDQESRPATRWWKFGLKLSPWSSIIITLSVLIINWWKSFLEMFSCSGLLSIRSGSINHQPIIRVVHCPGLPSPCYLLSCILCLSRLARWRDSVGVGVNRNKNWERYWPVVHNGHSTTRQRWRDTIPGWVERTEILSPLVRTFSISNGGPLPLYHYQSQTTTGQII